MGGPGAGDAQRVVVVGAATVGTLGVLEGDEGANDVAALYVAQALQLLKADELSLDLRALRHRLLVPLCSHEVHVQATNVHSAACIRTRQPKPTPRRAPSGRVRHSIASSRHHAVVAPGFACLEASA